MHLITVARSNLIVPFHLPRNEGAETGYTLKTFPPAGRYQKGKNLTLQLSALHLPPIE